MKNYIILLLITCSCIGFSQNDTIKLKKFNTKYFDAVDQYVLFPKTQNDETHVLGLIYIDEMAGFTFQYINDVIYNNENIKYKDSLNELTNIKTRLNTNTKDVYVLTEKEIKNLELEKNPSWLKTYKSNDEDVSYLTKIGYHYNHVGASHNAIPYLLKAYQLDKTHKNVCFELGFAYNATQQFEKAIPVIQVGLQQSPKNHYLYKELGYAYLGKGDLDNAEITYLKGLKVSKDEAIKCEMAVNMAQGYFQTKNKPKFNKWAKIARENGSKSPNFIRYIDYFEKELNK